MKFYILALAVALVTAEGPTEKAWGYHARFGIPAATRIRAQESTDRIVGGIVSYSGQNPFLAGLVISLTNEQTSVCAGTLLSNQKVLTAAQCWYDGLHQAESIEVVLGSLKLFSGGERRYMRSIKTHEGFDPYDFKNDLAMITIQSVDFTDLIKVASLPFSLPDAAFTGASARATGYGIISDWAKITQNQKQYSVFLSVISNDQCKQSYSDVDGKILCTDGCNKWGPCNGDGGAPLVISTYPGENMLIAVSSFHSLAGCQSGYPFGYMRVTAYLNWIQSELYRT